MRSAINMMLILLMATILNSQIIILDDSEIEYKKLFQKPSIPLQEALTILENLYQVHFIFEDDLLNDRRSGEISELSMNFHIDLQKVIGDNPIHYIKVGKKTFVLFLKNALLQQKREIRGRVTDSENNPVFNANIFIQGTPWGSASDNYGYYSIDGIPEGKYTLMVSCIGYRTQYKDILVQKDEIVTHNFILDIDILNMEEIVTIASRNPMTKIESSVAITTANSTQISERNPRGTADLLKVIPGFYVESSGGESGNNLFPRGIPQDGSFRYVAMYEDGLPVFESPELEFANIDILMRVDETIASMEGVRGGTGSIFASNAPGGIINFVSKTGGNRLSGLIKLTGSNQELYRMDFNYGGPLSPKWKFNIGGFYRYDKGIRPPGFAANKGGQIKANITYFFNKGYIRLYSKYLNDKNIFYLPVPLQNPSEPTSITGFDAISGTMTSIHSDNVEIFDPFGGVTKSEITDGIHPELYSGTAEFAVGFGQDWTVTNTFRYVTADLKFNAVFPLDNPFSAEFFADSVKQLYNQPGFNSWQYRYADTGQPLENISGLNGNGLVARNGLWMVEKPIENFINQFQIQKQFYNHFVTASQYVSFYSANDFRYWHNIFSEVKNSPRLLDLMVLDSEGRVLKSVTKNGFEQFGTFYVNARNEAKIYAAMLVDEWRTTGNLRFDFGVRFEHSLFQGTTENRRNDFTVGDGESEAEKNVIYGDGTYRNYDFNFTEWALSIGVNYSLTRKMALYSRIAHGYRTPDFDHWTFSTDRGHSQYVQQMEGGLKLAHDRVSFFGALFLSRLNNIPFIDEVVRNGKPVKEERFAKSTTVGTEMEAVLQLRKSFQFHLISTLQLPRLRELRSTTVNSTTGEESMIDLDGKRVRRIPQVIFDIKPVYTLNRLKFFGNWQYIGKRFVDDANTAALPAYSIINLGANYEMINNKIVIQGNVANLTNTIGLTEGNPRVEQVYANRDEKLFMARPILGRSVNASIMYLF